MNIFNFEFDAKKTSIRTLLEFAETKAITKNVFKEYMIRLMLEDDNIVSHVLEYADGIGNSLKAMLLKDISILIEELSYDPIENYVPTQKHSLALKDYERSIEKCVLAESVNELASLIIKHYKAFGGGKTAKYIAFKWRGHLEGIEKPEYIKLDDLFCLDRQKQELAENITMLLKGIRTNNVLLYGDSGSGKSSIVKALLNEHYNSGLRLVELPKALIRDVPIIFNALADKKQKYIIFMDDLSFEQNDIEYKDLKVALEGQIEKQPANVVIYATSNRRHIVSETWSERQGSDVHVRDTQNERLSLFERFGTTIMFSRPSQEEYLQILEGLLKKKSIPLTDEIKQAAIKWELSHGGRSGRAALQFSNQLWQ